MGALTGLGLTTSDGAIMCVGAPDSVLAEAARMTPRPSFAPSLLTAEPTARLLWWPSRGQLSMTMLARLRWLLESGGGQAWVLFDPEDEDSPTSCELNEALEAIGFAAGEPVPAGTEFALPLAHRS
jgi:hypothetical protein